MDVFKNTKKSKKFILIILAIMLFSFAIPKQVHAGWDVKGSLSDLFFWVERGVIKLVNNIFCDERHQYEYDSDNVDNTKIYISPESIIKGKFALLDPNIFKGITAEDTSGSPENDEYYDIYDSAGIAISLGGIIEGKKALRETISGWYYALRNLAIIALLSILVYVGIRMILSTLSQDKAKYKMMLKDWLVALCLVMVMHYIMIGTLNITSDITNAIGTSGKNDTTMQKLVTRISIINNKGKGDDHEIYIGEDENYSETEEEGKKLYTIGDAFAYELVLLGVIGYTIIFAVKYLIRMMTIVFLILVAPITAITYPIDKISDGKAQAFNMWFQEFLYEVIIQPFHLLIYVVLIGSATTLAETNWMYSIMCFAVMIPAEKFIKQMFGFKDKLGSPLGAFAGGALAGQLMNKAFSGGGSSSDNSPKVEGKSESDDSFRENKLKVGLPGSDEGTEKPATYDTDKDSDTSGSQTDTRTQEDSQGEDNTVETETRSEVATDDDSSENEDDSYNYSYDYGFDDDTGAAESSVTGNEDGSEMVDMKAYGYGTGTDKETTTYSSSESDGNEEDTEGEEGEEPKTTEVPKEDESVDEGNGEGIEEPEPEPEPQTKGIYTPNSKVDKLTNAARAIREHNDKKLLAKYGTKNRGLFYRDANGNIKRGAAGKYLGRKGAKYGKKAIKGATTLLAAGVAGVVGTMFGQGGKAALAGAAFGSRVGNKINDKASSAYKTAKEYGKEAIYATKDEDQRRREKVAEKANTPKEYENASRSFSKRHNGRNASKEEMDQELAERAKFKETGLTDSQIDDAMEIYHRDDVKKLGEEEAFKRAYASSTMTGIDFTDPKKVGNKYNNMMEQYKALGVNEDQADEIIRDMMTYAAATKGEVPSFPKPSRKEAYKADAQNKAKAAETYGNRHKDKNGKPIKPNKKQEDHELEMGYNLRKAGIKQAYRDKFFDDYLMNDFAREEAKKSLDIEGDELTEEQEMMVEDELERRFEIKAKIGMIDDKQQDGENEEQWKQRQIQQEAALTSHMEASKKHLKENAGVEKPTNGQVYMEVKNRLEVKDSYHVDDSEISKIRKGEEEFVKNSTDKDGARAVIEAQRYESRKAISEIAESKVLREENKPELMKRTGKEKLTKAEYQRKLFETHSKEELKDDKYMDKFANATFNELKERNQYSDEYAKKIVTDIINGSRGMASIETEYKFTRN